MTTHSRCGRLCHIARKRMVDGMFENSVLLITGGTGSFGNAALSRFLPTGFGEIRIFSRDEKKQDDMRRQYHDPRIRYLLGDVRDRDSLKTAVRGADYIFHAAALKQVPGCEFFPLEAVKTNVLGTDNLLSCALEAGVRRVVCLSTDKAVHPVNAMGISKAMMEKIMAAHARTAPNGAVVCATRYGNVMASRGSVIPLFIEQIKAGGPLTVTDGSMTRFLMDLGEAVDLVLFAFTHAAPGDVIVKKSPAATIKALAQGLCELFGVPFRTKTIGVRLGEKLHESLLTREECARAEDLGDFYRVPVEGAALDYSKYITDGDGRQGSPTEYTSENTERLDVDGVKEKLLRCRFVQNALKEWRG